MAVRQVLATMGLQGSWRIAASEVAMIQELAKVDERTLFAELVEHAKSFAQAPISNFKVGAIGLGASGDLYLGANLEFIGCPLAQAVHGEQCVISNAFLAGEKSLKKIVVSASPCGHCRQFMTELPNADDLVIHILSNDDLTTLGSLLPNNFKTTDVVPDAKPLLHHPKQKLKVSSSNPLVIHNVHESSSSQEIPSKDDDVMQVYGVLASATSYAPLTRCYSGVVLKTTSEKHLTGSCIESAAFNPTMLPLQVAYVNLLIHGMTWDDVTEVMLSEAKDNDYAASVLSPTLDILKNCSKVPSLAYLPLDLEQQ